MTLLLLIGTKALQGIEQIAEQSQHGLALATLVIFHLRKKQSMKKVALPRHLPLIPVPTTTHSYAQYVNRSQALSWHRLQPNQFSTTTSLSVK